MKKFFLIGLLALLGSYLSVLAFTDTIHAGTFTAFGPKDYIRTDRFPRASQHFLIRNPNASYTLHIYNGGKNNQFKGKITSAVISLNGVEVVRLNRFNQNVSHIEKAIKLSRYNKLAVEMHSEHESGITIEITGVDNDPPTIVATVTPSPNAAGWNNTNVTVSFTCSDTTSGIASCSGPVPVQQEGANQVITGTATDIAGNTASTSATVNLDKTSPTIAKVLTPAPNAAGWNNTNATVRFVCSDTASGIASCPGAVPVQQEGANQVITGTATDIAGNTASTSATVNLDKTPPTIAKVLTPAPNAAGWNNTNVTVSFVCSDTTSGIASCPAPVPVQQEGADQVITGMATDIAGNAASTSATVNIDKTPPAVTVLSPFPGANLQDSPVTVQGTINEALSGVAAITCNGTPAALSNSSFTCNVSLVEGQNVVETAATDLAGNTGYSSITVAFVPPALELAYVDQFQLMWWDKGSGGYFDGAYYRPIVPTGFYSLGHYGQGDYGIPRGFVFAARELQDGALASPVDYTWVYSDWGSGADMDGSFWKPVPPAGYVCLGLVAQTGYSKPSTDEIRCVRQDLTVPAKVGNTIWIDRGTGATYYFGSWQIVPADENGIFLGAFTGSGGTNDSSWSPPTDPLFTIDARIVRRYEPDSGDIEWLVQTYGPNLLLHPWEQFFLDHPEYVLDHGTKLEWGLMQNETSYGSFSFTPLGFLTTSAAGLMQDVESYVKSSPQFGNPSFRYYLRINNSLIQGNLDRAKALVRVRPWNWLSTELQFWFFYPFNGPGRAEVCASGNWCDIQYFGELGRHYGDWEHVTLRVDNRTEELISVYMSRHAGGQWITRGNDFEQTLQFNGTHPQIYAALHSHAHYSAPGAHDYYRAWEKDYWLGTASVDLRDLTDGNGPVFSTYLTGKYRIISSALPGYQVTEPEWLQFQGRWGQYERLSDDFRLPDTPIPVYTYTEVGSGPTGPAMKSSWTRGDSGQNWWWTRNLEGNEACFDGIDNDGDGEIDCHDPDCWQVDPVCIYRGWLLCHIAPEIFGPCPP